MQFVKLLSYMQRPDLDDPELRAWRDQTLYRLLLRASRAEAAATLERIHALGFSDVSLVDTNLLANLDMNGTTISGLARRAGVTRQAAGQQVTTLERRGYVERRTSDADGRVALIFQSARGRALLDNALDVVADLEERYAAHLGDAGTAKLKELLRTLLVLTDPTGGLGPD